MTIFLINMLAGSGVVAIAVIAAVCLSLRRNSAQGSFPIETTMELKGLAIILIVIAHIGYSTLAGNPSALTPLSNYAGVSVDVLFFMSGYGLVASSLRRRLSVGAFYKRRLFKVFVPTVCTVILFLILDVVALHRTYPVLLTIKNLFGFFPHADLYNDLDSPLWFLTPLLAYYLVFPLVFWRRVPWLSAVVMFAIGWMFIQPSFTRLVTIGYDLSLIQRVHFAGFSVGMMFSVVIHRPPVVVKKIITRCTRFARGHRVVASNLITVAGVLAGGYVLMYIAPRTFGWRVEQFINMVLVLLAVIIFMFKKFRFPFLSLVGAYSFEIYLVHWPLLYRYHLFPTQLPVGIATVVAFAALLAIGYAYQHLFKFMITV